MGVSWTDFTRERRIRLLLRRLSRQRVAMVLRPGNVWVVENAVESGGDIEADLNTCEMRGWVKPADVRLFLQGQLDPARTRELTEQMLAGLPL